MYYAFSAPSPTYTHTQIHKQSHSPGSTANSCISRRFQPQAPNKPSALAAASASLAQRDGLCVCACVFLCVCVREEGAGVASCNSDLKEEFEEGGIIEYWWQRTWNDKRA